jgi:hypothetical protein
MSRRVLMKNIYMLGDCHLSRAIEHYYPEQHSTVFIPWSKAGLKMHAFSTQALMQSDDLSSGVEIARTVNHGPQPFSIIKDAGVLALWMGYVDIRTFLSKYKNADETVKSFIYDIKQNFSNSKVVIIEPLPQFTEMLLKHEGISPYYTHEQRIDQNREFLAALHKYSKDVGFEIVIGQQDILDALGVPELTPSMTHTDAPHPVDGLSPEYMKKIWKLFSDKLSLLVVD